MKPITAPDVLAADDILSMSEAAKLIPTRPSARTLARWSDTGVRGVRLKSVRLAGRRITRRSWVLQFVEYLIDNDDYPDEERASLSCTVTDAEAELVRDGL